jgi:hypothetical protein
LVLMDNPRLKRNETYDLSTQKLWALSYEVLLLWIGRSSDIKIDRGMSPILGHRILPILERETQTHLGEQGRSTSENPLMRWLMAWPQNQTLKRYVSTGCVGENTSFQNRVDREARNPCGRGDFVITPSEMRKVKHAVRFILKTAVAVMKHRPYFDPSALWQVQSLGSTRAVFEALTKLAKSPFALSSLRSGRVEGLRTNQLPS